MGGRGSSSGATARGGGGGLSNATPQQQQKVKNLEKMLGSRKGASAPTITINSNGDIEYQYTMSRIISVEKGGKISNAAAADRYERTEYYSGKIKPDGYISKNKTTKKDILVQKGKR